MQIYILPAKDIETVTSSQETFCGLNYTQTRHGKALLHIRPELSNQIYDPPCMRHELEIRRLEIETPMFFMTVGALYRYKKSIPTQNRQLCFFFFKKKSNQVEFKF